MLRQLRNAADRVSIRAKLAAAFGLVFAVVVALGLLGLVQLHAVNGATQDVREIRLPQIETLQLIKRLTHEHRLLATRQTQTTNFHQLAATSSGMEKTEDALREAERSYVSSTEGVQEQVMFAVFRSHWSEYLSTLRTVQDQLEAGDLSGASRGFTVTALKSFESANEMLDRLIALSKTKAQSAAHEAQQVLQRAFWLTAGGILLAATCVLGAIYWVSRSVISPMLEVSAAMRQLSAGHDNIALTLSGRRGDEIGALVDAVSGYKDALGASRKLVATVEVERQRLQAAISNMPAGLCMFDRNAQLIICNDTYGEIFRLPRELTEPGAPLENILQHAAATNLFSTTLSDFHARIAASREASGQIFEAFELTNGRIISMALQTMAEGGWVAVYEDITERRRAEERIKHMAHHDALTDLPNRLLFQAKTVEAIDKLAEDDTIAVMCLDLDRFKTVNDTLGHPIGDQLLQAVAERLKSCVREGDVLARFGGDEFAIVQIGGAQPESDTAAARRIIETVSAPYLIEGHQIVIGVSIGIAFAPADGREPGVLLKNADMALYRAKAEGRGRFHCFETAMDARMQTRRKLELDLRRAVACGEFELYYQPVLQTDSNQVTSLEALIRWSHPERGMIAPAEFIPLAEEIGLIEPMGEWVLHRACRDAVTWPGELTVSVNLSPAQFRNAKLLDIVIEALRESKLPARRLELEITESVLLVETEATLAVLNQLHMLGVQIAMDDFGTGYSSLSYFRSFRFDRIKIDRSFIRNMCDDSSSLAVIRAVAGLSASLGMAVTAEGVETKEQLERLRAEGCKEVQGYFFSPPRPAREIGGLLTKLEKRRGFAA
jgi:diguanylate cyclase (GGDEF)-like protein